MPETNIPEFLPGMLYLLILRTLARGPLHGYASVRRIKDSSEEALAIEEGSLSPALNRMRPCGARLFPHPHCRAKLAPRPRQSFASRDAALLQFIGMRLYVELQFVIELMVEASPTPEICQLPCQLFQPIHRDLYVVRITS